MATQRGDMDAGLGTCGDSMLELERKLTTLNLATAGRGVVSSSSSSITPAVAQVAVAGDGGSEIFEEFPLPAAQSTCEVVSGDGGSGGGALVTAKSGIPASGGAAPDIVEEDGGDDGGALFVVASARAASSDAPSTTMKDFANDYRHSLAQYDDVEVTFFLEHPRRRVGGSSDGEEDEVRRTEKTKRGALISDSTNSQPSTL